MGANQAICDTADMVPRIVELAQKAGRSSTDYMAAVTRYETAVILRAFYWVKASGDFTNQWVSIACHLACSAAKHVPRPSMPLHEQAGLHYSL
jgi:hypothetical protein